MKVEIHEVSIIANAEQHCKIIEPLAKQKQREIAETLHFLKSKKHYLTAQEFKTLKGQILAGHTGAAAKGIKTIIAKKKRSAAQCKELQKI